MPGPQNVIGHAFYQQVWTSRHGQGLFHPHLVPAADCDLSWPRKQAARKALPSVASTDYCTVASSTRPYQEWRSRSLSAPPPVRTYLSATSTLPRDARPPPAGQPHVYRPTTAISPLGQLPAKSTEIVCELRIRIQARVYSLLAATALPPTQPSYALLARFHGHGRLGRLFQIEQRLLPRC